jgi:hypothetical protein
MICGADAFSLGVMCGFTVAGVIRSWAAPIAQRVTVRIASTQLYVTEFGLGLNPFLSEAIGDITEVLFRSYYVEHSDSVPGLRIGYRKSCCACVGLTKAHLVTL